MHGTAPAIARGAASSAAHWSALVAAGVDTVHVDACPQQLLQLQNLVRAEERRARTGAPLTVARVLAYVESVGLHDVTASDAHERAASAPIDLTPIDLDALDQALRPGGQPRPALLRAVAAAAAIPGGAIAELVPGLLLCSTGLTDRLRLLPFAGVDVASRIDALVALRTGDVEPFTAAALNACAEDARTRRMALRAALSAIASDEDLLAPLGRAAITARRALGVLRESLATSMPQLSVQLECSRPAAGDALERLEEVGLAVEITGRQRDRVYACARAYSVVSAT